jgi:hypothetical protein
METTAKKILNVIEEGFKKIGYVIEDEKISVYFEDTKKHDKPTFIFGYTKTTQYQELGRIIYENNKFEITYTAPITKNSTIITKVQIDSWLGKKHYKYNATNGEYILEQWDEQWR